ncbi:hypothetical protein SEMRO_31_G020040.1 [Seminavis robusta]|uniref:Uncharacterized protein n=1 Tax=Seminavis robusta TaxID=568900 RepID=A0A9N8DC74_9STRA|nr:hypothetical protein SEMRO_31_G020040.1 [Seminavis robusta]|eukprot:Sro31_g020040.1 n/a (215) ;mRNA; r:15392-16036
MSTFPTIEATELDLSLNLNDGGRSFRLSFQAVGKFKLSLMETTNETTTESLPETTNKSQSKKDDWEDDSKVSSDSDSDSDSDSNRLSSVAESDSETDSDSDPCIFSNKKKLAIKKAAIKKDAKPAARTTKVKKEVVEIDDSPPKKVKAPPIKRAPVKAAAKAPVKSAVKAPVKPAAKATRTTTRNRNLRRGQYATSLVDDGDGLPEVPASQEFW